MERRTRSYLQLIKPGITLSNTLTGIAGFFLAASIVPFKLDVLIGVVFGIALTAYEFREHIVETFKKKKKK